MNGQVTPTRFEFSPKRILFSLNPRRLTGPLTARQMEPEATESDHYQAFIKSLSNLTQNSTEQSCWTKATTLGLAWIIHRVQSDLEPLGPHSGYGHLFCDKGLRAGQLKHSRKPLRIDQTDFHEYRAFLLRLISFKPKGMVQIWRETYVACITNCLDCAAGHDVSLTQLAEKWLPLYHIMVPGNPSTFIRSIYNFLIVMIRPSLEGVAHPEPDTTRPVSFSPTFAPLLSIVLSRPELLTDSKMWPAVSQVMANQLTRGPFEDIHAELSLPGLILLTMNDNVDCAALARQQLNYFKSRGSASNALSGPTEAMKAVMAEITMILNRGHINSSQGHQLKFLRDLVIHPTRENSWLSLASILPALSSFPAHPSNGVSLSCFGLPKLILDHIADLGGHLPKVYSCWGILLRQLGSSFWTIAQEASNEPSTSNAVHESCPAEALQKVFGREDLASNLGSTDFVEQCLDWLLPFVRSVTDSSQFSTDTFDVLKKILVDQLQRSPYDVPVRVGAANLTLAIWRDLLSSKASSDDIACIPTDKSPNSPPEAVLARTRVQQFLRTFLAFFVDLAYDSRCKIGPWAQQNSLKINKADLKSVDLSHINIRISKPVWIKIYQLSNDYSESNQYLMKVFSLLIRSLSNCAHIDHLASVSWLPPGKPVNSSLEPTIAALNNAVSTIRAPLVDALIDLSGSTYGSQLLATLMKEPSIIKAVIILIFSPNDGLHTSSLALVRQWSDCTSRLDCLRALLSNGQRVAFEGMIGALKNVDLHAKILPDAMSLARRFVRCMTDVISIFCSPTDGLLRDESYIQSLNACDIVEFWSLMCSSVANIFARTPHWAEFWQSTEMTEWMRDALIFAEQLVKTFQIFEAAACGRLNENVDGNESLRSKMVDSFMRPTESIVAWLRLNDADLLDRSTGVTVQMLEKIGKFKRPLNPAIVERLAKYIERSSTPAVISTNQVALTNQQCVYLKNALATHPDLAQRFATIIDDEDDEDEIEIAETGDAVCSLPSDNGGNNRTHTSQWTDIFPQIKSSAGPSTHANQRTNQNGQPKARGADQPTMKVSYSRPSSKPTVADKPAPRRTYAHDSVIGNLRKEMKASARFSTNLAYHLRVQELQNNQSNQTHQAVDDGSEETSEDDVQETTGLAGLVKAQKGKTFQSRKLAEPRRRIKMFNDPAIEKQKKVAQARREQQNILKLQKLRMQPDFTDLHRYILQWDYNHTGPCPPSAPTNYNHLPPSFGSFSHYLSCLEPLLMCETWQQISQAKESVTSGEKAPIPIDVVGRTSDLVLVRSADPQLPSRCIMAKVIGLSRKPESFELNLRLHFGSARQEIAGYLVPKTKWVVVHLCSLSTTHREWAALRSLPYLTLGNDILQARATSPAPIAEEHLIKVMRCQKVNEPQVVRSSVLLRLPGKTSTIVGLIGAFIASRPKVDDSTGGGPPSITRKILLCAPSNAAVDEVAKRLKEGVRGAQGELIIPKLVRIGADSKVNLAVKDIFIDELVEAMSKDSEPGQAAQKVAGATGAIQDLRNQLTELRDARDSKQMEAERLATEAPQYRKLQEEARDQQDASKRYLDAAKRKLRMQILQDADVVCSTLSGSGHDYMSQLPFDFETVVIDEACQCVEPASLIPLRYNATQCILVGDPMQLPPTVLSQTASRSGYDQSLFVRMQRNAPDAAHLLSIQYRMHPSISTFPSKAFYDSRLLDGPDMGTKAAQPWHQPDSLPPYAFFHPVGAREERGPHHSILNRTEAALAVSIYWRIANDHPQIDFAYRVGIITGYAAQVGEIRRQLRAKFPADVAAAIDVNTVDGFQGQEKDIIILSCDIRRMNVALTRAKSSMFIIGNRSILSQDPTWKALVEDAAGRSAISEVTSQTFYSTSSVPIVSKSRQSNQAARFKKTSKPLVGLLMTPKQASEQSQARGTVTKAQQALKRKISIDASDGVQDRRDEAAGLSTIQAADKSHAGPSAPVPVKRPIAAMKQQAPRPKPAPSLFIKKPKREIPIRRPSHPGTGGTEGNRSVRQRMQDEMNMMQRPNQH
ncbi:hypothetical protein H4Q26_001237 [Puccinia striiformis f. sp. tritici PST-130]|nr:hypothetical protein H4Q26_001237 [Puccinia striiformis f. sp. tritici PST-130]